MKILYQRKRSHGGVDFANAAFTDHDIMSGELAGMKGKAVYANLAHIGHKRQQKRQLLIHGHYYANFHKTLVYWVVEKRCARSITKQAHPSI